MLKWRISPEFQPPGILGLIMVWFIVLWSMLWLYAEPANTAHSFALENLFGGAVSALLGFMMVIYCKQLGPWFARMGKAQFKGHPLPNYIPIKRMIEQSFDESKSPRGFQILGFALIVQGPIIILIGYITSG